MKDHLESFQITWFVHTPIHVTASSSTVIDNVIRNLINTFITTDVNTAISYHHLTSSVEVIIKNILPEAEPPIYQIKR